MAGRGRAGNFFTDSLWATGTVGVGYASMSDMWLPSGVSGTLSLTERF
jgi:hypothetical protein